MDFSELAGVPIDLNLHSESNCLRKSLYIGFANTRMLKRLYIDVLTRFKKFVNKNLLQERFEEDILKSFFKNIKYLPAMREQREIEIKIEVYSRPILPQFKVASTVEQSRQVITKMGRIGYQHLHILEITDSSGPSDTEIEHESSMPLKLKLKGFHKALGRSSEEMTEVHFENVTRTSGKDIHVDILIFMDKAFCGKLAEYLGLIYVEDVLNEAGEDFNNVLVRLNKSSGILFRFLQNHINKELINGKNNICLIHHLRLWNTIKANVKAVISTNESDVPFMETVEIANFHVELGENVTILDYVESVALILEEALNMRCHIPVKYMVNKITYRKVKLPLIAIIPLNVLRYFRHCRVVDPDPDLDIL